MATRLMFLDIGTLRPADNFAAYGLEYKSSGDIIEGNWDNLCSAGISAMVVRDTYFGKFKVYTDETAREGVSLLRAADLVIGYNLRNFVYPVLSVYSNYALQKLPTFDLQAEIQFTRCLRAGKKWGRCSHKIPFISLSNIAKYTCDLDIMSTRSISRLWHAGDHKHVLEILNKRVVAIQRIFTHGCKHGAISYKQAGFRTTDPNILLNLTWKDKARAMVDSDVPKTYLEEKEYTFSSPPERMFALPNPIGAVNDKA